MNRRNNVQSTRQRGGENAGTGWRSLRGSTLAAVALVVLTLAVVAGVGVAGAASGTTGAATTADATSVAAAQDDAKLDADITYIHDPSADAATVDPTRETIGFYGFNSSDATTEGLNHLEFEWVVEKSASGSLTTTGNYSTDFFAEYELADADAGESFDVQLTISDENGTTATDTFTVHVTENDSATENLAPSACLVWTEDPSVDEPVVTPGETVRISAADSTDPDHASDELDYDWEIDDVASGDVTHEDDGAVLAYDVSPGDEGQTISFAVTVTDPEGANDTMAIAVDVAATAEPESPTAAIDPLDENGSDHVSVTGDRAAINFTGFRTTNPNGELRDLDFEWSVVGNASGGFAEFDAYDDEWFTSYELGPDDAGATFDIVLTVTDSTGATSSDSVTVEVAADWNGSDGDSSDGPTPFPGSGTGSDGGSSEGDEPATAPFAFSVDSTSDSIVLRGENAQAGSSASIDLAVVLGGVQLNSFEGEAAGDADAFEVTIATSDRSGPNVDGDVVQVFDVSEDEMLASSTLELAVASSALDAGNATVYEYTDGEWTEADAAASDGTMRTDIAGAQALAVVSPSSDDGAPADDPDDADGDDDGFGTIAIALLLGVLLVVGGVEYYRRQ